MFLILVDAIIFHQVQAVNLQLNFLSLSSPSLLLYSYSLGNVTLLPLSVQRSGWISPARVAIKPMASHHIPSPWLSWLIQWHIQDPGWANCSFLKLDQWRLIWKLTMLIHPSSSPWRDGPFVPAPCASRAALIPTLPETWIFSYSLTLWATPYSSDTFCHPPPNFCYLELAAYNQGILIQPVIFFSSIRSP